MASEAIDPGSTPGEPTIPENTYFSPRDAETRPSHQTRLRRTPAIITKLRYFSHSVF